MIAFTTLIPLHRNDGTPISEETRTSIIRRLVEQFGPLTIEGEVSGFWYDSEAGELRTEQSLKLLIGCEWHQASNIEPTLRAIGIELGQEAMFLEIHAGGASYISCVEHPPKQPRHGPAH